MTQDENDYDLFCKNRLLQGLNSADLKALYDLTEPVSLKPEEVLFSEGEQAKDLYFITRGTLDVTKYGPEIEGIYVIETAVEGDVIGELAFIDQETRSASVRAKTECSLRRISFDLLEKRVIHSPQYSPIYILLAKRVSQRLRSTSEQAIESLKKGVQQNKIRVRMGNFLVYIITALSFFAYGLNGLQYLIRITPNTSYIALPLTLIIGISLLILIVVSKFSWKEFGVSLLNWRRAVLEGFILSLPLMAFVLFVKWAIIHFIPDYQGQPLFNPFAVIFDPEQKTWMYWLELNSIYWIFIVPFQELLTRGLLQGMLETFLSGKYKIAMSILMSNLVFSESHLFLSFEIGILTFGGGIYIGWIYSRTHNLISSIISHAVLGTWALSIVGTAANLQKG